MPDGDYGVNLSDAARLDDLTDEERRVIASLQRLARHWPASLMLISMEGGLHVIRTGDPQYSPDAGVEQEAIIADIDGIPDDGGAW